MTTALIGDVVFDGDSYDVHVPSSVLTRIDEYLDDGECSEIKLYNIARLKSFNPQKLLSKLKNGGSVSVYDLDAFEVCYAYTMGVIKTQTLNELMSPRVEVFHRVADISESLMKFGVDVQTERYDGFNYFIGGVKNV